MKVASPPVESCWRQIKIKFNQNSNRKLSALQLKVLKSELNWKCFLLKFHWKVASPLVGNFKVKIKWKSWLQFQLKALKVKNSNWKSTWKWKVAKYPVGSLLWIKIQLIFFVLVAWKVACPRASSFFFSLFGKTLLDRFN